MLTLICLFASEGTASERWIIGALILDTVIQVVMGIALINTVA